MNTLKGGDIWMMKTWEDERPWRMKTLEVGTSDNKNLGGTSFDNGNHGDECLEGGNTRRMKTLEDGNFGG